ncbi:hypothetical protein PSI9734_02096 [Pseudidiomarina piscicola]|uniref:Uncharacterized protein n=1 Tax=Pseudidiomarina piscicola TaxID=2614830 RepID=A0A6S6WNQ6_9GAMM|nr:hypothetical protein [Pseudidiomarina piscicola]CAB0151728.1 hypothetical protein PSI9734_02096 [Pseudidiomarina piscicola]VZT41185.1 hypothetical protein PSI9734_02096 [Pseudomonas aeruginosa]
MRCQLCLYQLLKWLTFALFVLGVSPSIAAQQSEQDDSEELLEDIRSGLQTTVGSTAAWLDSFFTESIDPADYNNAKGSLTVRPEWDEYGGFKIDSSFRAKVILPHAERKISAIIGRGDFDDFINDQQTTRPTVIQRSEADEEWMIGLGFDPVVHANHSLSFGAGFRGGLKLDPYVRSRYRYEGIINERSEIHLQTVGFWRDSDGFGVAQTIEHDFALSERWFNKFWVRGTVAERTQGLRWHASEKLYYIYHHERAIGAELWWYGETSHDVPMQDYGLRALHRSRLLKDWFYLETWVGLHWPRETQAERRQPRWLVGLELELQFGS